MSRHRPGSYHDILALVLDPPIRGPHCHKFENGCVCPRCKRRAEAVDLLAVQGEIVQRFVADEVRPKGWYPVDVYDGRLRFARSGGALTLLLPRTPADPGWLGRAREALHERTPLPWEDVA